VRQSKAKQEEFEVFFEQEKAKIKEGAELPPGVLKMVKVYVATRKTLQVGDVMQNYPLLREYERLLEVTKTESIGEVLKVRFDDRLDSMRQGKTLFYEAVTNHKKCT